MFSFALVLTMQQPMNYCTGMRATNADDLMKATFDDVVKRFPAREPELQRAQRDWVKKRDAACQREGEEYESGSIQPQIENQCLLRRTSKRIRDLRKMAGGAISAAAAPSSAAALASGRCVGDQTGRTQADRRAWVIVDKSHFQDQAKACPSGGTCPWRRNAYVVRGDEVTESASTHDFACVTYKATIGWLPLGDLCEAGPACPSK